MSILGNVAGLAAPQPDWNQTDSGRADFIKNKPALADPGQLGQALELAQGALQRSGGAMTGAVNMNGQKVTGLGAAQADGDAVSLGVLTAFYAGKVSAVTVSLPAASWAENQQTVSAAGVTASNTVVAAPAPGSWKAYCQAGVRCAMQGAGTLSFRCEEVPGEALAVNILILN